MHFSNFFRFKNIQTFSEIFYQVNFRILSRAYSIYENAADE